MKYVVFFAVFLISVNLSLQVARLENCASDYEAPSSIADSCALYTCDGSAISGVGCAVYRCAPEKYLGYNEPDDSKVYPDCCGGPICAD